MEEMISVIDPKYVITLEDGKEYPLFIGLLESAKRDFNLKSLTVRVLQFPNKENNFTCICEATAVTSEGETFTDIGDANPLNCDEKIAPHSIRLSATRAKNRALAGLVGSTCSYEELNSSDITRKEQEPVTPAQEALLKRLAKERGVTVNFAGMDKTKASQLINQLQQRKTG